MSKKTVNDSCKDIAADLREDARQIRIGREIATRIGPQPTMRGRFLDEIFAAYADRLDDVSKPDTVYNMAAMREALESARNWCLNRLNNAQRQVAVEGLLSVIDAALSAQPRNCDLFDTKDKSREAFQKLRGHCVWSDVSLWDDRDEIEAFLDWLFAHATEQEGGAK